MSAITANYWVEVLNRSFRPRLFSYPRFPESILKVSSVPQNKALEVLAEILVAEYFRSKNS